MKPFSPFAWILFLCLAASVPAAEFRVGFATADITPPVGWRRAGNFSELLSTGVHDPLMSKAMVVQEGATAFAFVGNDLCSVPRDLTDLARAKASQLTGIPVANIVITATHTHGGPEYCGPLRDFLHARAKKRTAAATRASLWITVRNSSITGPGSSLQRGRTASRRRSKSLSRDSKAWRSTAATG